MPLNTTTITLGDELERLQDAYDDLDAVETDSEEDAAAVDTVRGHLARKASAVQYLIEGDDSDFDGYGADATVTVGGLDMGDKALVRDKLESVQAEAGAAGFGDAGAVGTRDLYEAAAGLVDAPFVSDDIDDPTSAAAHGQLVATLSSEYPQVTEWIVDRIRDQTALPDAVGNA
ncbi:hypothetical protein [Halosimplex halophilum]|uniref:hypothetical protein n=1 Tax=Halosimplex halophilum TaxID=2559572 RepID=UPI00107F1F2C|nr:hypothetical protein [Halosimplex halophilum]